MNSKSFASIAAEAIDRWRAADGGLTIAALDIIRLGEYLDRLLAEVEAGEMAAQEAQDILYEMQFDCRTGTESDLVGEALEYISRFMKNK